MAWWEQETKEMIELLNIALHLSGVCDAFVDACTARTMSFDIAKSGLRVIHVGAVKEEKLDGFVVLLDDSNMHSMEFFDEIQNVKWLGAVCVGIMANAEEMVTSMKEEDWKSAEGENKPRWVKDFGLLNENGGVDRIVLRVELFLTPLDITVTAKRALDA
ncbi:hypothetical protein Bca4012_007174 [Brassica carinata]